jgi:hypothetical protein
MWKTTQEGVLELKMWLLVLYPSFLHFSPGLVLSSNYSSSMCWILGSDMQAGKLMVNYRLLMIQGLREVGET